MTQEADMTTTAHMGKAFRSRAAGRRPATSGSWKSLGRRPALRLWTILHAQALLNATEAVRYGPR